MADTVDGSGSPLGLSQLFSCAGQVAIVTGATSAIGRASAEALAAAAPGSWSSDSPMATRSAWRTPCRTRVSTPPVSRAT